MLRNSVMRRSILLPSLLVVACILAVAAATSVQTAVGHVELLDGDIAIDWTIVPAEGKVIIDGDAVASFSIVAKTNSWVGFGVNPVEGEMPHSDVYAGWAFENGTVSMDDYLIGSNRSFSCGTLGLCPDLSQSCHNNILRFSGSFVPDADPTQAGVMTLNFSRLIDTQDKCDYRIQSGPVNIVSAMGGATAPRGRITYHGRMNKDYTTVTLWEAQAPPPPPVAPVTPPVFATPVSPPVTVPTTPVQSSPPTSSPAAPSVPLYPLYSSAYSLFDGYNVSWTIFGPSASLKNGINPNTDVINVSVVAVSDYWAGFGWNPATTDTPMLGADVYIALRHTDGSFTARDYKIGSSRSPACPLGVCADTDQGCTDDLLWWNASYAPPTLGATAGTISFHFSRKLITGDKKCDFPLDNYNIINIVGAAGPNSTRTVPNAIFSHGKLHSAGLVSLLGPAPVPPVALYSSSVSVYAGHTANWTIYGPPTSAGQPIDAKKSFINVTVTAQSDYWVGFGWNPAQTDSPMLGADVYIALRGSDGVITVQDYKLGTFRNATCPNGVCRDDMRGCTDDIIWSTSSYTPSQNPGVTPGTISYTFSRKLITGDLNCDFPLDNYNIINVIGAAGPNSSRTVPDKVFSHGKQHGSELLSMLGSLPTPVAPTPISSTCPPPAPGEFQHSLSTLGGRYTLHWSLSAGSSTLSLAMVAQTTGWVGFGIATASGDMVGSEAIIGWAGPDPKVSSRFLGGKTVPEIIPYPAIPINVTSNPCSAFYTDNGVTYTVVRASRGTLTGHNVIQIAPGALTKVVIAMGPPNANFLYPHRQNDKTPLEIDFSSGAVKVPAPDARKIAHGALMFASWGVLLQFGSAFARYAKPLPNAMWFKVHRIVQIAGFVISIAGFILAIVMTKGKHFNTTSGHAQVGLTVMILGIIQVALALFRPNPANLGQVKSIVRVIWEFLHWWMGRIALVLAVAAIFLGLQEINAPRGFTIAWGILVGIAGALIVGFELYRKFAIDRPAQAYEYVRLSQTDKNLNN